MVSLPVSPFETHPFEEAVEDEVDEEADDDGEIEKEQDKEVLVALVIEEWKAKGRVEHTQRGEIV